MSAERTKALEAVLRRTRARTVRLDDHESSEQLRIILNTIRTEIDAVLKEA
jgi:hypothetical protein